MKIKLTKIDISDNPESPTSTDKTKQAQDLGNYSPWISYEIIGETKTLPQLDKSFDVLRHERNGVEAFGYFHTSPVKKLDKIDESTYLVETLNSKYKLEIL